MLEMTRVLPLAQIAEAICKNSMWCDHCCMFTVEYRHPADHLACPLCKWSALVPVQDARDQLLFISEERAAELAADEEAAIRPNSAGDASARSKAEASDVHGKIRALLRKKAERT